MVQQQRCMRLAVVTGLISALVMPGSWVAGQEPTFTPHPSTQEPSR